MADSSKLTIPDLVALSLICEAPCHGYELNRELEIRQVADWAEISRPQVYYSLRKLEGLGLIEPVDDGEPARGPRRCKYRATGEAQEALTAAVSGEGWTEWRRPSSFLTWMALCHNAEPAGIRDQIERRRGFLERELEREHGTVEALDADPNLTTPYAHLMVDLIIRQFETELAWLDEVEEVADRLTTVD